MSRETILKILEDLEIFDITYFEIYYLEKEKNKYKGEKGLQFSRTGLFNSQIIVLKELLDCDNNEFR